MKLLAALILGAATLLVLVGRRRGAPVPVTWVEPYDPDEMFV